jgi:putative DNA methylase
MMATQNAPRKKLIEVSIPLEAINAAAERVKKKAPKGYYSAVHKYWAQRPLPACRAVLFAQLVDDPSACVEEFPTKQAQNAERDRLHKLIAAMAPWEASGNERILNEARYEIARSVARGRGDVLPPINQMKPQQIVDYLQEHAPPICDPFVGAGSIPLEAQRLGLKAVGSDLNPLAVLISKAVVELPAKFSGYKPVNPNVNELQRWNGASGLADDVRYYGRWMRQQAYKKIGHLYPKVRLKGGKEATTVAWLWARTVPSPDPRAKNAHVPLVSSFVLSTKADKEVIVKPVIDRVKMEWRFEINEKPSKDEIETAKKGTKASRGANFVCLLTGAAIDDRHVKAEAKAGRMAAALMAIVAEDQRSRVYVAPLLAHVEAAEVDAPEVPEVDQPMPKNPRWFSPPDYGMPNYKDLFTARQLLALTTFYDLVMEARERLLADAVKRWSGTHTGDCRRLADGGLGPVAYADAVAVYLAFIVSRMVGYGSTITTWLPKDSALRHSMPRQALQMTWDFAEANVFGASSGDHKTCESAIVSYLDQFNGCRGALIEQGDAVTKKFVAPTVFCTDPPYYDNVGYADLSDYFYLWLRRSLRSVYPEPFRRLATPKREELVATPYRHGTAKAADAFFMDGMKKILSAISETTTDKPATIFYAYKQQEFDAEAVTSAGWASFLQAVVDAGLSIDGTWPIRSEGSQRVNSNDANALASSIVLVCRRRDIAAPTITRADFIRALRREMPVALGEIRHAGVGPTDIQQAAIGPGIGIFTRYSTILNTDGTPMLVKDALKLINQVREEITAPATGEYDPETLFALDWFAAKGFERGRSGDAIVMTNAVNLSLDGMNAAGFFLAGGGVARLLKREELPDDWDPKNRPPTVWEACQHLIKRLRAESGGIDAAAALYNRLGSRAEPAHALARRLYDICEQNQWAAEGYVYNQLHQEWDAIEKRAAALSQAGRARDLFSR